MLTIYLAYIDDLEILNDFQKYFSNQRIFYRQGDPNGRLNKFTFNADTPGEFVRYNVIDETFAAVQYVNAHGHNDVMILSWNDFRLQQANYNQRTG